MFDKNLEEDTDKKVDELEIDNEVLAMVGEGKKYGSVEAALKSIKPAQEHIATLETEAKQLRDKLKELEDRAYADQVKDSLKEEQPSKPVQEVDISNLVKESVAKVLTQAEKEKQAKLRQSVVVEAAIKSWGSAAETSLYTKAAELGLSPTQINDLSATSPEAALKLLGIEPVKPITQYADLKPTVRTTQKQPPAEKPTKPVWGNDAELVDYIRKLDRYLADQKNK